MSLREPGRRKERMTVRKLAEPAEEVHLLRQEWKNNP
jgi:hypothetical protein